jgi:hypothetical protein
MSRKAGTSTSPPADSGVGYGRPPEEHRFKKGTSGNPRGRPRKTHSETDILSMMLAEAFRPVPVTEKGKARRMPVMQVVFRNDLARAAKGTHRLSKLFSDILRLVLSRLPPSAKVGPFGSNIGDAYVFDTITIDPTQPMCPKIHLDGCDRVNLVWPEKK